MAMFYVFGGNPKILQSFLFNNKNCIAFLQFVYGRWLLNGIGLTILIYSNTLKKKVRGSYCICKYSSTKTEGVLRVACQCREFVISYESLRVWEVITAEYSASYLFLLSVFRYFFGFLSMLSVCKSIYSM